MRTAFVRRSRLRVEMGDAMLNERDMREPNTIPAKEFAVVKRSVVVDGHKTSVSLEDAFWTSLKEIAMRRGLSLSTQIAVIDQHRKTSNLSSAIRLFVLDYFRSRTISTMLIGERQSSPSLSPALID
jgi:predicted DNA-binding ribbon-helix-helix protein